MTRNKKNKCKVTSTAPSSALPTTIASLPDDVLADILLRLPSAAAIHRAVLASKHWIRVASCPTFRRRLRDVHSYPLLLGHFVAPDGQGSTPPHFQPVPLHSEAADGVIAAMVRRGDFFLTRMQQQVRGTGRLVLEDCSGGLLLFSDSDTGALRVFDPMTHRVSLVEHLPSRDGRTPDHRGRTLCLLPNGDEFRVMSLQHRSKKQLARLEVYSSCTRAWSVFPVLGGAARAAKIPSRNDMAQMYRGQAPLAMHAGDRVYWKYTVADSLLSLDTKTMTFSKVRLPLGVECRSAYAVGETEDGTCCLVHVERSNPSSRRMQVWRFKSGDGREGNGNQMWELEREVPLILDSQLACLRVVDQVRAIVGGIVLLSFYSSSSYQHHIAFRLKSLKVEADFTCRGLWHIPL